MLQTTILNFPSFKTYACQVVDLLERAHVRRVTATTQMNTDSSRSHFFLRLVSVRCHTLPSMDILHTHIHTCFQPLSHQGTFIVTPFPMRAHS